MLKRDPTKPSRCKVCRGEYIKRSMGHKVCKPECAQALALAVRNKAERKAAAAERVKDRAKKEALKTRSDHVKAAQVAFNLYVRTRDIGLPCASCGALPEQKFGGTMDCSHYRSVGSAPHLRFHLHNAASACVKCNRYLGGNVVELRKGLIARIGLTKVEAVEADSTVRKFPVDYLKRIKKIFTKKAARKQRRML